MIADTVIRALQKTDDRSHFDCGVPQLNLFFTQYAAQNQFRHHIGVTYVAVCGEEISGLITVSPASIEWDKLQRKKKLPRFPIPALRVSRLAVDLKFQGRGIGRSLLRFAIELAEKLRGEFGCAGILIDAKKDAVSFYESLGFFTLETVEGASPIIPRTTLMFLSLQSVPRQSADR